MGLIDLGARPPPAIRQLPRANQCPTALESSLTTRVGRQCQQRISRRLQPGPLARKITPAAILVLAGYEQPKARIGAIRHPPLASSVLQTIRIRETHANDCGIYLIKSEQSAAQPPVFPLRSQSSRAPAQLSP